MQNKSHQQNRKPQTANERAMDNKLSEETAIPEEKLANDVPFQMTFH
jgi:hypothetical protein